MNHVLPDANLPQGMIDLLDRSGVSLTVADLDREDAPLIALNQAFLDMSGYAADDVLGRNCRFLQPEGGAGPVRDRMRRFLGSADQNQDRFVVPNVRKDGTPFLNVVYMGRLKGPDGRKLMIASQFSLQAKDKAVQPSYEDALKRDLRELRLLTEETGWVLLGSYNALAVSNQLIAQARLDG